MQEHLREILIGYRAGKAVYGIIIALAIIVTLDALASNAIQAELAILLGTLTVAMAEFYSEYLQRHLDNKGHVPRAELKDIGKRVGTLLVAAWLPLPFFLLATFGLISTATAIEITTWLMTGLIFFYAFITALICGANLVWSIVIGSMVGFIGILLVLAEAYI